MTILVPVNFKMKNIIFCPCTNETLQELALDYFGTVTTSAPHFLVFTKVVLIKYTKPNGPFHVINPTQTQTQNKINKPNP